MNKSVSAWKKFFGKVWNIEGEQAMIILGIDPGTATTGFGIIRVVGNSIKPVDYGIISTPAGVPMERAWEPLSVLKKSLP